MFDIGWSEMAVIAVIALIVLGPKELPNALRSVTQWMKTARKLAREFQSGVDQIVRESELDEARKAVQQATKLNLGKEIEKTVDPTGEAKRALNQDPDKAAATVAGAAAIGGAPKTPTPVSNQLASPASAAPAAGTPTEAAAAPQSSSQPEPAPSASGENHA